MGMDADPRLQPAPGEGGFFEISPGEPGPVGAHYNKVSAGLFGGPPGVERNQVHRQIKSKLCSGM